LWKVVGSCGAGEILACFPPAGRLIPESDFTEKLLIIDLPDDMLKIVKKTRLVKSSLKNFQCYMFLL
jgi:hypothetical protein